MFDEIIKRLQDPDPSERRNVAEELMTMEINEQVVRTLCKMLEDEDKGVIDAVSFTLAYNGNSRIPFELVPYVSSPNIIVRNLAGDVFLKIGTSAIPALVDYIDRGNDDDQKFVIDLLGLMEDQSPIPKILEVLHNSKNDNVVLACLEAIGHIRYTGAMNELVEMYDKNELFKPTTIEALGNIGSEEALDFMLSKYAIEDDLTKFSIIESLGQLGNEETFFFLISELRKTEGPLKWPIIASLYQLKEKYMLDIPFDENIKNSFLATLIEAETKYKIPAASMIVVFDDKDILDALLKVFGEDFALDDIIKPKLMDNARIVFPKISEMIKQKTGNVRGLLYFVKEVTEMAGIERIRTLSALDLRNLIDSFTVCLDDPDEEVRKTSVELLFAIDAETGLLFADSIINDDNMWNRLKLLELIESYEGEKVIQVLKALSQDPEEMVRERAEWLLTQKN